MEFKETITSRSRSRANSYGDSPPYTHLRRTKSLTVKSIDNIAFSLMQLVTQHDKASLIQDVQFEQQLKRKRNDLYLEALGRTFPSAIGAAMCAAMMPEDIKQRFEDINRKFKVDDDLTLAKTPLPTGEVKNITEDYLLFSRVCEYLASRKLIVRFQLSPKNMTAEEIDSTSRDMHTVAFEEVPIELKFLLACRLEALGKIDLAVDVYINLLRLRFSQNAQIANLIRIGTQSAQAQYTLAKLILDKTEIPEHFTQPLKDFATISYQFASNIKSENHLKIRAAQPPKMASLYDGAMSCLQLAVYAPDIPHTNAVKLLANIYEHGIEAFIPKSPKKACILLYYGYTKILDEPTRERLLDKIHHIHRSSPQDIWVNFMLGNYHLTQSRNLQSKAGFTANSPRFNDQLQAAYEYYRVCTKKLEATEECYTQDNFEIINLLSKKLFEMAQIYADRVAITTENLKATMINTSLKLYTQAGKLGNYDAHRRLAQRSKSLKADNAEQQARLLKETESHYCNALEAALANLNKNEIHTLIEEYHQFLKENAETNYQRYTTYIAREKELLTNLEAIEIYRNYHTVTGLLSFTANSENKVILEKIRLLDPPSPITCTILWSTADTRRKSDHSKKLLEILTSKGFGDRTSPIFIDIVITKLIDYFNLARQHNCALKFFPCLREALLNRIKTTDAQNQAEITTLRELNALTEFTHGILENDHELMQGAKNLSPDNCKRIFSTLASRLLLTVDQYKFAKSIFEQPKPLLPSLNDHSDATLISPQKILRKSSAAGMESASPETKKLIHEWAKLPSEKRASIKRHLKFAINNEGDSSSDNEEQPQEELESISTSAPSDSRRAEVWHELHMERQRRKQSGEEFESPPKSGRGSNKQRTSFSDVTDLDFTKNSPSP